MSTVREKLEGTLGFFERHAKHIRYDFISEAAAHERVLDALAQLDQEARDESQSRPVGWGTEASSHE